MRGKDHIVVADQDRAAYPNRLLPPPNKRRTRKLALAVDDLDAILDSTLQLHVIQHADERRTLYSVEDVCCCRWLRCLFGH